MSIPKSLTFGCKKRERAINTHGNKIDLLSMLPACSRAYRELLSTAGPMLWLHTSHLPTESKGIKSLLINKVENPEMLHSQAENPMGVSKTEFLWGFTQVFQIKQGFFFLTILTQTKQAATFSCATNRGLLSSDIRQSGNTLKAKSKKTQTYS